MTALAQRVSVQSLEPGSFASDVLAGLTSTPKRLAPKYFYDEIGAKLFEGITALPEYYPTRCELRILRDNASKVATFLPKDAALVEFGSGSAIKARILLDAASQLAAYVPVDISAEQLEDEAVQLRRLYPKLKVFPVAADFTKPFELPIGIKTQPRAGFFPGSTIGNFEPHEASAFLRHAGKMLGFGALLVIGVDLIKSSERLNAAYNDSAGVTAQFNRNLLARINRELGGTFDLKTFEHHAFYNRERHRIEMHLASIKRQRVKVLSETIEFRAGETIHTENSYKYTLDSFVALARGAGWAQLTAWTDPDNCFSVHVLTNEPPAQRAAAD